MNQCQACAGRATVHLCTACTDQLRRQLHALTTGPIVGARIDGHPIRSSGLIDDLIDVTLRRTRIGNSSSSGHRKRGDEQPALYEPDTETGRRTKQAEAAIILGAINTTLTAMIDATHAPGGITTWQPTRTAPTGFIGPLQATWRRLPTNYRPTNTDMATWLTEHTPAIASDENAGHWLNGIAGLTRRIERVIDRPEPPRFIGPCPAQITDPTTNRETRCSTLISARPGAIEVTCPNRKCRAVHNVERLETKLLNEIEYYRFTRPELLRVLERRGEPITRQTLHDWVRLGKLKPAGYRRPDGRFGLTRRSQDDAPVYRLADVRKLMAQSPRKARAR